MARDAGTKQDQPSDQEGQGPDPKVEQDAAEAKAAQATEQAEVAADASEETPKPKRKRAPKKADGTAAAKTDVDKDAAEAGATGAEATQEKPKRSRAKTDDSEAPAEKPARRRRGAAAAEAPKPAPSRRRGSEERVVVRAHAKYVRVSPRKARLIADHVRGKDVQQARAILAFSPRAVAEDWRKVLESAIANAEHNHDLVGDDLRILNATADEGPTLKRFRPRAMGRATKIRKRTSHLTITLTPKD
jgi:ribosomal protein L22